MLVDQTFSPIAPRGFIVLEGVNGAGKTTLQKKLSELVQSLGRKCISTREPGATELGKAIRPLLLSWKGEPISHLAELFLFAADRNEHVEKVIRPSLNQGSVVISDRYYYSTEAFQGAGRKLNKDTVHSLMLQTIAGVVPDLVVLLDLDPKEGLRRTSGRTNLGTEDSFELEALEFHQSIRDSFLDLAKSLPEPFLVINAEKSPEEIFSEVESVLRSLVKGLK